MVASPRPQATFCATLVDEWVRGGVTDAVVCPGSRSTPLALALDRQDGLRLHLRLDERSAGFFALGLAGASGRPVVVCTTSGTAAVELHPAVVEAHHHGVPLLVCTADRPPELHEVGAPQTVEQEALYGEAVRWRFRPGVADQATSHTWRSLGARVLAEAVAGPRGPGPVHCNLPFREPLEGDPAPLPWGRPGGAPWHRAVQASTPVAPAAAPELTARVRGSRGLIVAGEGCGPPEVVLGAAAALGWPVLADPRSGCRRPGPGVVVAAADAVLRSERARTALRPDVALLLGSAWASKVLGAYVREAAGDGTHVILVDPWWRWSDPDRVAAGVWRADPAEALQVLAGPEVSGGAPCDDAWSAAWASAEAAAQKALDAEVDGEGGPAGRALDEVLIGRRLLPTVGADPAGAAVVLSSSMPVRDVEWYAPLLEAPPPVWSNRGANGIDGVVSTALGFAAAGRPVVALLGDLAFLHDAGALVRPRSPGPGAAPCTLVVVDNAGGGIFSFLPQRDALDEDTFERLLATPMEPDVLSVARGFGVAAEEVTSWEELAAAVARPPTAPDGAPCKVVRAVVPSRRDNVARHDEVHRAVVAAVEQALGA